MRPGTAAGERRLAVVLHDAAPATWPACRRVLQAVESVAPLPVTLLAVPRYHGDAHGADDAGDAAFDRALEARLARGDEIALHGYTHADDGTPHGPIDYVRRHWYTAGEGEFSALGREEAERRLRAGMRWFACRGWPLHGFVAPAWLMSEGTWQALDATGLRYTCTLRGLHALRPRAVLASQGLVYSTRSRWRRALSRPWNRVVARGQADAPLLRLELHPHDADHPQVRRSWMRLLERFAARRCAVTLADAVRLGRRDGWFVRSG